MATDTAAGTAPRSIRRTGFWQRYFSPKDHPLKIAGVYLILLFFCFLTLYPMSNILTISLRPKDTLFRTKLEFIPADATLDNYKTVMFKKPLGKWLVNSLKVSVAVGAISVVIACSAGYAFARWRFWGSRVGLTFFLTTQMFPAPMLLLPTYLIIVTFKLTNSHWGLLIPYVATAIPFSVWLMKGFFDTIPRQLEESAYMDGANHIVAFFRVILPLSKPGLAVAFLNGFMAAWSEYIVARVILTKEALFTLPVGLVTLQTQFRTEWGTYSAAALLTTIPVMIVFIVLSRFLVGGLTLGSVKG